MTDRHLESVSQRYRELPPEEPPRALDEAILAAARREVRARPAPLVAPTGRRRWYVPVAAAAVIVLAVAVTLRIQLEQPDPETTELRAPRSVPAPTPAPPAAKPDAKKEEERIIESGRAAKPAARAEQAKPAKEAAPEELPRPFALESAPAAAMRAPAPAMKPAPRTEDFSRERAASAAGVMGAKQMEEPAPTPEKELERIAGLRKAGRHDEADKALVEFRKRYPDYRIPEQMLQRVERR